MCPQASVLQLKEAASEGHTCAGNLETSVLVVKSSCGAHIRQHTSAYVSIRLLAV